MREIIAELDKILPVVERVHGENHPELHKVAELYTAVKENAGVEKDDAVIAKGNAGTEQDATVIAKGNAGTEKDTTAIAKGNAGTEQDATVIAKGNASAGIFAQLREITSDFTAPEDACPTYRKVYADLAILEGKLA